MSTKIRISKYFCLQQDEHILKSYYNYIDYDESIKQIEKEFLEKDLFMKTNMFVAGEFISSIIEAMITFN